MRKAPLSSQKSWLTAAKRTLAKTVPSLTWDEFARMAGSDPRAFKTYRMPEDSADYRTMPEATGMVIEKLLADAMGEPESTASDIPHSHAVLLLIPSLAGLVVRLAQMSLIEGRMVSGTSRDYGDPVGLTAEDRRAMSAVSRACLVNRLPDHGAEIHNLLELCTHPLGDWLPIQEVKTAGLANVRLINADEGIPTIEAEELSARFGGMTAGLEEQLFAKFMELIGRHPEASANAYYTKTREFVVRNPVCDVDHIKNVMAKDVPAAVWVVIQQQFYEPVPAAWAIDGEVPICCHCGNAMKVGKAGLVCRTTACASSNPASSSKNHPVKLLLRVSRGIRQYWVEPGIDELRLYDALKANGIDAHLYPFRDRVDISVGDIGIDLKIYVSPETLGLKFKRSVGGLAYYKSRWLVIPDWHAAAVPSYMDRLDSAMDRSDVECLTVSAALTKITKGQSHA